MLQISVSFVARLNESLEEEWEVQPPGNNVAAIPNEATAMAINFCCPTYTNNRVVTNVFPISSGSYPCGF